MPAHRNDEKAAAMYELYQQGFSLSQVGKAFCVSRQGVFKMFLRRKLSMRTIQPLPFVMWSGRKFTQRENGYYACTTDDRSYLHRVVWEHHNGAIPAGYEVHHEDEDKTNNDIRNLRLLTSVEHGRLHSATNEGFKRTQFKPMSTAI